MTLVIDASVIVKWFLPEDGSSEARALSQEDLIAPELWVSEVANALWKRRARGDFGDEVFDVFLTSLASSPIKATPAAPEIGEALALASRLNHPIYDCLYLACALRHGVQVVTADRRFFFTVGKAPDLAPHIRLLGA